MRLKKLTEEEAEKQRIERPTERPKSTFLNRLAEKQKTDPYRVFEDYRGQKTSVSTTVPKEYRRYLTRIQEGLGESNFSIFIFNSLLRMYPCPPSFEEEADCVVTILESVRKRENNG